MAAVAVTGLASCEEREVSQLPPVALICPGASASIQCAATAGSLGSGCGSMPAEAPCWISAAGTGPNFAQADGAGRDSSTTSALYDSDDAEMIVSDSTTSDSTTAGSATTGAGTGAASRTTGSGF